VIRNGAFIDGGKIDLSDSAGLGIATWWPDAGSKLYRHPNGRAWLDVVQAMDTQDGSNLAYIIYQRREVTSFLLSATRHHRQRRHR